MPASGIVPTFSGALPKMSAIRAESDSDEHIEVPGGILWRG
jgi:hypothetical protein